MTNYTQLPANLPGAWLSSSECDVDDSVATLKSQAFSSLWCCLPSIDAFVMTELAGSLVFTVE